MYRHKHETTRFAYAKAIKKKNSCFPQRSFQHRIRKARKILLKQEFFERFFRIFVVNFPLCEKKKTVFHAVACPVGMKTLNCACFLLSFVLKLLEMILFNYHILFLHVIVLWQYMLSSFVPENVKFRFLRFVH